MVKGALDGSFKIRNHESIAVYHGSAASASVFCQSVLKYNFCLVNISLPHLLCSAAMVTGVLIWCTGWTRKGAVYLLLSGFILREKAQMSDMIKVSKSSRCCSITPSYTWSHTFWIKTFSSFESSALSFSFRILLCKMYLVTVLNFIITLVKLNIKQQTIWWKFHMIPWLLRSSQVLRKSTSKEKYIMQID